MSETSRSIILNPSRIGLAETLRQDWVVNAEQGTTIEDAMDPGYWAHAASQFSVYDRVEVRLETGEWLAEMLVLGVGRNWAQMHLLTKHDLAPVVDTLPGVSKYKTMWRGPQHKHCVVRVADNAVILTGYPSAALAQEAMQNHERVTG